MTLIEALDKIFKDYKPPRELVIYGNAKFIDSIEKAITDEIIKQINENE